MTTLPVYQTCKQWWFYPRQGTDNTLAGEPVLLPAGSPIGIVCQGAADPRKFLVQSGDLLTWIWGDWIFPEIYP